MPLSSMIFGECFQTFPHPTTAAFLTLGFESFNPAEMAKNTEIHVNLSNSLLNSRKYESYQAKIGLQQAMTKKQWCQWQ